MSRAILSIIDKIRARWAWHTAWEDSPKIDVQRNSVTGEKRWRKVAEAPARSPGPWIPGLPRGHVSRICIPGKPPIVYGATKSGLGEAYKANRDIARDAVVVDSIGVPVGSSILQEAMRRASENMQMTGGLTMADREGPARSSRVVIRRHTESFYSVEMEFSTGVVVVQENQTMREIGRIINRMKVTP